MQNIEVVCNMNLVRSPFLATFLQMHFPDVSFESSGVNANSKFSYDGKTQRIGRQWGFDYPLRQSKASTKNDAHKVFLPTDHLTRNWLLSNVQSNQVLSYVEYVEQNPINTPIDPIGFDESRLKFELSKLLCFGVNQLKFLRDDLPKNAITTIIPNGRKEYCLLIDDVLDGVYGDFSFIVDSCLKDSKSEYLSERGCVIKPHFSSADLGTTFSSPYEVVQSEKVLCSVEWRNWLVSLSDHGKVVILAPPLSESLGSYICDSFLASIWATRIIHAQ